MSTNYYAFGPFPGGDPDGEGLHIGQTAAGWRFLFRAQPALGITTLGDWLRFLHRDDVTIQNEYGYGLHPTDMEGIMRQTADREGGPLKARFPFSEVGVAREDADHYVTSDGHAFSRRDFC